MAHSCSHRLVLQVDELLRCDVHFCGLPRLCGAGAMIAWTEGLLYDCCAI